MSCRALLLFLLAPACGHRAKTSEGWALGPSSLRPGDADRGGVLGRKLCTSCHGVDGDGRGEAAEGLEPPPRDFIRAVYRYRSTPSGSLPIDADLARTIRRGLPGTSMPGFGAFLGPRDVRDLVAWVKSFSPRFDEEEIDPPVEIPPPPPMTETTVARGRAIYRDLQCAKCHGDEGRGGGSASEDDLRDALGRVVRPRDFSDGIYKSGRTQEDLYRTFVTGLDGSPMPAYEEDLPPEDVYSLVHFLLSLERERGFWYWLTRPPSWFDPMEQRVRRTGGPR